MKTLPCALIAAFAALLALNAGAQADVAAAAEEAVAATATAVEETVEAVAEAAAPVAEAAAEETGVDENELIAVITAALMAYTKGNGNKTLVVKNIRRANAWAAAGKADQLTRF